MVMPAIHMTKEEVADVFSEQVEQGQPPDIPRLVKFARGKLRTKFLSAEMGITGANIAVAETGSLVIITNEGNARLVTTLPKIHVAIVGIEKLMADFADVVPVLTALPRSATAQLLTSYVSIISGPVPNTDGTPKQLHIILMDNRRTEMSQDPKFKQALQCIRCASCLNVCPVFRLVGGHVFGKIYTGGIGTILTAWFDALKASDEIQSLCIQCGNCTQVCPGKIDIPDLILELRRRLAVEKGQPLAQKAIFSVVNNRRLFHSMLRTASLAQKPLAKDGFIRHLPLFLSDMTEFRSLPAIADDALPRQVQARSSRRNAEGEGSVLLRLPHRLRLSGDGRGGGQDPEQGRHRGRLPGRPDLLRRARPLQRRLRSGRAERAGQHQRATGRGCGVRGLGLSHLHGGAEARLHQHLRKPWASRFPAPRPRTGGQGHRLLDPGEEAGRRGPADASRKASNSAR